jgi:hypothetical protein
MLLAGAGNDYEFQQHILLYQVKKYIGNNLYQA